MAQGLFDGFPADSAATESNLKGFIRKGIERLQYGMENGWDAFMDRNLESGSFADVLNDFYDPENYEDYEKHKENAEYADDNYSYLVKFFGKIFDKKMTCKELYKDPNNPKWKKGAEEHCY